MVTMKDVAKAAGVSVATVSNYLNSTKSVSFARGERIAEAIEKLNYIPNLMAKTLKENNTREIGIILPNISDEYYVQIFNGIESYFTEQGYYVNLGISNDLPEWEKRYVRNFIQKKISGMILVSCRPNDVAFFDKNIYQNQIPFVHLDRRIPSPHYNFLGFQNEAAIFKLTESLLQLGKRKIALLAGSSAYSCEKDAVNGYKRAYEAQGLEPVGRDVLRTLLTKEAAFRSIIVYLRDAKPDAVITTSKLVTAGVVEGLSFTGLRIPEDVLVATLGEDNWNRVNDYQYVISTARQSLFLGDKAARLLESQIKSPAIFETRAEYLQDRYHGLETSKPMVRAQNQRLRALMLDTLQVDLFSGLVKNFEHKTGIQVEIVKAPQDKMLQMIYHQQKEYDLFMFDMPWLYTLAKDGVLKELTELMDSEQFDRSIYLKNSLDYFGLFNSGYYGLPFMYAPQVLFYRQDYFEDVKLQNEFKKQFYVKLQPPRTWTEFNAIAKFFTKKYNPLSPTAYGTAVPAAYEECLLPELYMRMRAYGAEVFNDEYQVTFRSVQTLKAIQSLEHSLQLSPPDSSKRNDLDVVEEFMKGNVVMLVTYPPFISDFNDLQRSCLIGRVGVAHIPGKCPILGGWSLGISAQSGKAREAFRFMDWACGKEIANYSAIMAGQSAVSETFDNNELITLYPWMYYYKNIFDRAKPILPPYRPGGEIIPQHRIDHVVAEGLFQVIEKKASAQDAMVRTQRALEQLFSSSGYLQDLNGQIR